MARLIKMILRFVLHRVLGRGPRTPLPPPSPRNTSAPNPTTQKPANPAQRRDG